MTVTAPLPEAGYSKRPLSEKLGFRAGMTVAFIGLPAALEPLAASGDFAAVARVDAWSAPLDGGRFDAVHAFTSRRDEVEAHLAALEAAIRPDGMIWVSWPKKASKVPTDVTEDVIRNAALALDLVDVKVAAIDPVWSGLKLMIRKDRRGAH